MFKIAIVVLIINNALPSKEYGLWESRVKDRLRQANVELSIVHRPLKERYCERHYGAKWIDAQYYYQCLKRYRRLRTDYNFFVRKPYIQDTCCNIFGGTYKAEFGAGLAGICVRKQTSGIGFAVYRTISPLADSMAAAHEIMHMVGAVHQEVDPLEIMYPQYLTPLIEKNGGMSVGQSTINSIKECLS